MFIYLPFKYTPYRIDTSSLLFHIQKQWIMVFFLFRIVVFKYRYMCGNRENKWFLFIYLCIECELSGCDTENMTHTCVCMYVCSKICFFLFFFFNIYFPFILRLLFSSNDRQHSSSCSYKKHLYHLYNCMLLSVRAPYVH